MISLAIVRCCKLFFLQVIGQGDVSESPVTGNLEEEQQQGPGNDESKINNQLSEELNIQPLEVFHVDKVVSSVVASRAADDPRFEVKQHKLISWQHRANLLNATWRAIFSMTEEWSQQYLHALLIAESPGINIDVFAIRDMVSRIRKHLNEEPHPALRQLIGYVADNLSETEWWCNVIKAAVVSDIVEEEDKPRFGGTRLVLSRMEFVKCIDITAFCFERLKQLLSNLKAIVFRTAHGFKIDDMYWIMSCEILSTRKINYALEDISCGMAVRVEGHTLVCILLHVTILTVLC